MNTKIVTLGLVSCALLYPLLSCIQKQENEEHLKLCQLELTGYNLCKKAHPSDSSCPDATYDLESPLVQTEFSLLSQQVASQLSSLQSALLQGKSLETLNPLCESVEEALKSLKNYSPTPSERQNHLKICEEHSRNFERIVSNIEKDYAKGSEKQGLKFDELEDQITRERLAHTKEIQQKIALVGEMMKDCAETVHQQGEDLDRIDLEVDRANKYTAKADVELEKTDLRQRRKKCFCWSIMIASAGFVVALVIVVVLMTKK